MCHSSLLPDDRPIPLLILRDIRPIESEESGAATAVKHDGTGCFTLVYLTAGKATCTPSASGEAVTLARGEAVCFRDDSPITIRSSGGKPLSGFRLFCMPSACGLNETGSRQFSDTRRTFGHAPDADTGVIQGMPGRPVKLQPVGTWKDRFQEMYDLHSGPSQSPMTLERLKLFLLLQQLLLELLERQEEAQRATEEPSLAADDALHAVALTIEHLHEHYAEPLTSIDLARRANLSVRQYARLFKRLTGVAPMHYLNDYRIQRSKERLLLTGEPLDRISRSIGIKDVHYFNRRFKQRTGTTPKEYVRARERDSRIVTMHYVGEILALGMRPLGALDHALEQCQGAIDGIASIGQDVVESSKLEKLQPDLILASDFTTREEIQAMARLAPIIIVPWDERPADRLQRIAKLLGKEREAARWMQRYEAKKREAARRSAELLEPGSETAAVLRIDDGKVWVHTSRFFPTFYEVMGFRPSPLMQRELENGEEARRLAVGADELERIEADRLYIIVSNNPEYGSWLRQLEASPGWRQLSAWSRDRIYYLKLRGISYDASTLEWQLGRVEELLGSPRANDGCAWLCDRHPRNDQAGIGLPEDK